MYQRLQPPGNVSPAFFLSLSFCCTVLLAVAVRTLPTGYSPSRRFVCVDVTGKASGLVSPPACRSHTHQRRGLCRPGPSCPCRWSHPGFPRPSALLPEELPSRLHCRLSSGPPRALTTSWCLWFHCEVKVAQLCPTLFEPMDYTVQGILQARILEWVAFPFPGDLPDPGMEPRSPTLQVDSLPAEPAGKPLTAS